MATKDISDQQVCEAFRDWWSDPQGGNGIKLLMDRTGQCGKVCYAAAFRADKRGLIDYGVSIRVAWVTDKGEQLLGSVKSN